MIKSKLHNTTFSALLVALVLSACGGEDPATLLKSARELLEKNNPKGAVIHAKNVLQKQPGNAEARFLLGKALLAGGDANAAEIELRKAMEQKFQPDETTPLLMKAMVAKGQAKKVIEEFGSVGLASPAGQAEAQTILSIAHRVLGNQQASDAALAVALKAKSDHLPALLLQARLAAANKDLPGALAMIDGIVQKDPKNADAYKLKGDILLVQDKPDEAITAFRKGLEGAPDHLPSHVVIVTMLLQQGKLEDAEKQLGEMKKFAAKNPQTLFLESQLAFRKKDFATARDRLQQFHKVANPSPVSLQLAGAVEYQLGSYTVAEDNLAKALQENGNLVSARRLLVSTYLKTGQSGKALEALKPVLDKIDSDATMLALAGETFIQQGDFKRAEEYYAKATKLDPKDAAKRTRLAVTHLAKGDSATAIDELEDISASDAGSSADYVLISAHLRRNELEKALQAIDTLQKKKPQDPAVFSMRGQVLLAKKDQAGARQNFEKALSLRPSFFPAAANLAALDLAERKPDDAKRRYEGVLKVEPKSIPAHMGLVALAEQSGAKTEEVVALINKAIAANATNVAVRLALIETYLRNREPKKAVVAAQEGMNAIPDRVELVEAAGRAQMAAGDYNQALSLFKKMSSMQPRSPVPYFRMAEVKVLTQEKDEAIRNLKMSLDVQPGHVDSQRALVTIYLNDGRYKEALSIAKDVQKQLPKSFLGYALEGDVAVAQKSWGDAAKNYRIAIEKEANTDVAIRLYKALAASGNKPEAEKLAVSWLKDRPKDLAFRNFVAEKAIERQDWAAAVQQYRIILEAQPDNPIILNNLAWNSGKLNDAKALEYAEKANKIAPNQPPFMDTLAMLLAERGDVARAKDILLKAVELAPKQHSFRLNLARVLIKAGNKPEARTHLEALGALGNTFAEQAEVAKLLKEL